MSKYIVFIFITVCCILYSCGNNSGPAESNNPVPAEEKKLRDQIDQYPDSLSLRNKLIDYFAGNSDYENAIKENNKLLIKDSSNEDLWDSDARLRFLNRDTIGAINAFLKAIRIFPDPQYIISLSTLYAQTGNPLALSLADTLIQKSKGTATLEALFIKGLYFNYAGDKLKAIFFFDECLKLNHLFLDGYREKAIALYDLRNYTDALKVLELETTLSKTNDEAYYWMGLCYEKLGKKEEAIQNYQLAVQFNKDNIEATDALGKLGIKTP